MGRVIEPDLGPIVNVTVGPFFQRFSGQQRPAPGEQLPYRTVRAVVDLRAPTTLISERLRYDVDPSQTLLDYILRRRSDGLLISEASLYICIEEMSPLLFKAVKVLFATSLGPVDCILGRDYLRNAGLFLTYDGAHEVFQLHTTSDS